MKEEMINKLKKVADDVYKRIWELNKNAPSGVNFAFELCCNYIAIEIYIRNGEGEIVDTEFGYWCVDFPSDQLEEYLCKWEESYLKDKEVS